MRAFPLLLLAVILYNLIEKPILRALQGLGKVAPDRNIIAPSATPP